MRLSVIIPIKNGAAFIADTVRELQRVQVEFELIIVNDGSTDDTLKVIAACAGDDSRIQVVDNPGTGKVQALNYGFSLTQGAVIKCIDGDDILVHGYIDDLASFAVDEAECHDLQLTNAVLQPIGQYTVNPRIISASRRQAMEHLVSLPRCSWTFPRELAQHIFPMPVDLPFEDVWFSLVLKRYAGSIRHRTGLCYQYRQHGDQTYGGILNQSREKVTFRAKRMLRLIEVLTRESARLQPEDIHLDTSFASQARYWELLAQDRVSTWAILSSGLPWSSRGKLILFRRIPWFLPFIIRGKYRLDKIRLGLLGRRRQVVQ